MDTQTRHALKKDSFVQATQSSVSWISDNRTRVIRWTLIAAAVLLIFGGGLAYWTMQSSAADKALGAALDIYTAPLAEPGAPAETGVYASASQRAKEANQQFVAVAKQYGWLPEGAKAHYFAGVTYEDMGQTASAESELKAAAGSWNRNLSNLATLALAGLYHQTGRDAQAIDLYSKLAAKPSDTVPATVAQLDLADLYDATGKKEQARLLWAKVKDGDKEGTAGAIAAQKLGAAQ